MDAKMKMSGTGTDKESNPGIDIRDYRLIHLFERKPDPRGGWANYYVGSGRVTAEGHIYDCPCEWSEDLDACEEIYEAIEEAIYEGKDEVHTHGMHIVWEIDDDEEAK